MARRKNYNAVRLNVGAFGYTGSSQADVKAQHAAHKDRLFAEPLTEPIVLQAPNGDLMVGYRDVCSGGWAVTYPTATGAHEPLSGGWTGSDWKSRRDCERDMRRHMAQWTEDRGWLFTDDTEGLASFDRWLVWQDDWRRAVRTGEPMQEESSLSASIGP